MNKKDYNDYSEMEIAGDIIEMMEETGDLSDVIIFIDSNRKYLKEYGDVCSDMLDDYIFGDKENPNDSEKWFPIANFVSHIIHNS